MRKNKRFFSICLLTVAIFALGAAAVYASGGEGGHEAGSLDPKKLWDLLYRTLNFAGLVAILVFFLKKPIANGLSSRRQAIMEQFDELDARKSEAEQKYKEYEAKLGQIDMEVQKILDAAVAQGELEKQKIVDEANRAAADIKRQAEMAIQNALGEAKNKLRDDIATQAVALAEELIKKNLQSSDQVKLVEDCLSKIGGKA
jgi:F-type H+-transporting ATPase subunit b